jgi:hypothetical protein
LTSHASHWPEQTWSQQKLSTQKLDWHSVPALHESPLFFFGTHTPPEQSPVPQSLSIVQLVGPLHRVPTHAEPDGQSCCSSVGHLPDPLQYATSVAREFVQSASRHETPAPAYVHALPF